MKLYTESQVMRRFSRTRAAADYYRRTFPGTLPEPTLIRTARNGKQWRYYDETAVGQWSRWFDRFVSGQLKTTR